MDDAVQKRWRRERLALLTHSYYEALMEETRRQADERWKRLIERRDVPREQRPGHNAGLENSRS